LFGAGIHDVAHVAGAGLSVSESTSAASIAVKMVRVACLLPVIVLLSLWFAKASTAEGPSIGDRPPALPLFLIGFALVGGLNMAGFMPSILAKIGTDIATYLLVISMAAIGLKTSIRSLMTLSGKLWLVLGLQTVLQLSVVITLIHWLY
jgi:uncharacterized membrane protein YadS